MVASIKTKSGKTAVKRVAGSTVLRRALLASLGFVVGLTGLATSAVAAELNIYSHRQQFLLQPFLDAFTAETGISTKVVYASKGLAQRLKAEGEASPADVILTVDIARLSEYADLDLLAPVSSDVLNANIPAHLRAADNRWFAFSIRTRIIVTSKERVAKAPSAILRIWPIRNGAGAYVRAREAMSITGR